MVAEEAKHPVLTQQQIDQLPLEKRIAELIWRLRDQNGQQMSQPGWCSVLGYGDGESAGHQLVKIGYPAAPALIEALTDDRFSRSVGFHRNFHFSHTILTIGDCAQQILQEISGQGFYSPDSTSGNMSNEDKMLAVQKAARVWWDGYQKKGLKQMLVDDISSGQKSPHSLVEQLKKEDASAVEAAVLAGAAKAAADEWMARQFIDQLDALKSPQSITALAKIMKEHPKLEVRLDAAARLLNHDHPDTLNTLLHDWSAYPPAKEDHDEAFEAITDILACQGGDQAVQALASGWDARAARQRLIIVQQIGSCMAAKPRDHSFDSHARPRKPSPQAKERAVELLVHALEDTETSYGMTGGGSDLTLGEASIGDFALQALHQLDAAKYTFSPKAARRLRDTERITMANLWRKEHGQPLLPLPPPPGPKLPPAEALKIVRVSLEPADAPAADGITKKAQSLQGRSFAPETIPQLLLWFAQANLPGVRGLDIEASRENDLTGVEVYLRVHLGQPKNDDSPDWQIRHGGRAGEKQLGSSSGSSSHSNVVKPDKWEDFEEVVREALKQPPQTEFRFHAGLRRE
jgi:hypothetical protein